MNVPSSATSGPEQKTILIVDDAKSMRDIIESILVNAGFKVSSAADGIEALDLAKKQLFDMVVTDLHMPNKSGLSLISSLRMINEYDNVPILLVTTENSATMKLKSKKLGANGWITKPIDASRLLTAIEKTFEKFA